MDFPDDKGVSERSRLRQVAKSTNIEPEFDDDSIPEELAFLWSTFWELYSADGIMFSELLAWEQLTGIHLVGMERRILMAASNKAVSTVNEIERKKLERSSKASRAKK